MKQFCNFTMPPPQNKYMFIAIQTQKTFNHHSEFIIGHLDDPDEALHCIQEHFSDREVLHFNCCNEREREKAKVIKTARMSGQLVLVDCNQIHCNSHIVFLANTHKNVIVVVLLLLFGTFPIYFHFSISKLCVCVIFFRW